MERVLIGGMRRNAEAVTKIPLKTLSRKTPLMVSNARLSICPVLQDEQADYGRNKSRVEAETSTL